MGRWPFSPLWGKTTVEPHLISWSKHSPAKREDSAFLMTAPTVSDVRLDCSSRGRQVGRLINGHPLHFLPTGDQNGQSHGKMGRETVNELVSKVGSCRVLQLFNCLGEVLRVRGGG